MIALSPKDSAILGDALQYTHFSKKERLQWLLEASKQAQDVGKYMLSELPESEVTSEIREAAAMLERWLETNRKIGEYRQEQRAIRQAIHQSSRAAARR